jgi:large subunit ribosomal protein L25
MATQVTLQASRRTQHGKGAARSLRRDGKIPAVIYGHGRQAESLVVDAPAFGRVLPGLTSATMIDLSIDGGAPVKALIRELQRNPLRAADIEHVDFYEVRADEAVSVSIPVKLVGTADGVRNGGGVLDWVLHTLDVEALPADVPEHIDIDVSALGVGQSLHVGDVSIPNVTILNDEALPICSVVPPRTEEAAAGAAETPAGEPELIRKPKGEEDAGE